MSEDVFQLSTRISQEIDTLLQLSDLMSQSDHPPEDPYEEMLRLEKEREKILQFFAPPTALDARLQQDFFRLLELHELQQEFALKRQALQQQYSEQPEALAAALAELETRRQERLQQLKPLSLAPSEQRKLMNHLLCHAVNTYFDNVLEKTKLNLVCA